jgi:hypothetical protein
MTKQERQTAYAKALQQTLDELTKIYGFTIEPVSITGANGRPIGVEIRIFEVADWTPPAPEEKQEKVNA